MQITSSHKTRFTSKLSAAAPSPNTNTAPDSLPDQVPVDTVSISSEPLTRKQRTAAAAPDVGTLVGASAGVALALLYGTPAALLQWPLYTGFAGRLVGRVISDQLDPEPYSNEKVLLGSALGIAAGIGYSLGGEASLLNSVLLGYAVGREVGHLLARVDS